MLLSVTIPKDIRFVRPLHDDNYSDVIDKTQAIRVMNVISARSHAMYCQGSLNIGQVNVSEVDDSFIQSENLSPGSYRRLSVSDAFSSIDRSVRRPFLELQKITSAENRAPSNDSNISKHIVRRFKALVIVESTEGSGTSFHIYIPTKLVPELVNR